VSLPLILTLALGLAVMWRLARLAVRLGLLLLLVALIAVDGAWSSHSQSPPTAPPAGTSARVAHVADGDTLTAITAGGPVRVRLLGIDAPELSSTRFRYPTCGGRAAAVHLRALAPPGTPVQLITDPASGDTHDAYHRLLAYVDGPHGDLGEVQLCAGEAIVYRYHGRRFSRLAAYLRAEQIARAHDRGAWRSCHGDFRRPVTEGP
jgi:endonuclease YncB( thermonuclease family)